MNKLLYFGLVIGAAVAGAAVALYYTKDTERKRADEEIAQMRVIKVKISFRVRPPKIWLLTNHKRTLLDEDTIATLQYARIENADVVVSPWRWEVNGKTGIAAYLETLYVKIEDDPFADKYADYESSDEVPF